MIEIVCPSCGARYQVPDDSIGPEGRRVTCSSCSHKWRAHRESAGAESLGSTGAEAGEAVAASEPGAPEPVEATAEAGPPPGTSAADFGEAAPQEGGREQQMDNIRRMLDDLKRSSEDEEPGPEPTAAAVPKPSRPEPSTRRRDEDDELEDDRDADPLKSRIAQLDKSGRGAKETERASNYDAARLRKMHEKRARRLQKAKERRRKSGAFLTGFTLVAVVAGAMVGLYVMKPQIVASSPGMEPALDEYVVTVDRYRLALDEATADWRAWAAEQVGQMTEGEQGAAQGQEQEQDPALQEAEPTGTAQ